MKLNYHNFSTMSQELQFLRADFEVSKFGSQEEIKFKNKRYTTTKLIGHLPGIHVISAFSKHLDSFRRDKKYPVYDMDPQQIFINRRLKKETYNFIDVKRCYWHTAYTMGLMPYRLYMQGVDNEEYKDSCNAAIGRLGMNKCTDIYRKGKLVDSKIHIDEFQQYVRWNILDEVNKLMRSIIDGSGKDYAFILTDGLYLGDKADYLAKEIISNKGYEFHSGLAQVNGIGEDKVFFNETYFNYSPIQIY